MGDVTAYGWVRSELSDAPANPRRGTGRVCGSHSFGAVVLARLLGRPGIAVLVPRCRSGGPAARGRRTAARPRSRRRTGGRPPPALAAGAGSLDLEIEVPVGWATNDIRLQPERRARPWYADQGVDAGLCLTVGARRTNVGRSELTSVDEPDSRAAPAHGHRATACVPPAAPSGSLRRRPVRLGVAHHSHRTGRRHRRAYHRPARSTAADPGQPAPGRDRPPRLRHPTPGPLARPPQAGRAAYQGAGRAPRSTCCAYRRRAVGPRGDRRAARVGRRRTARPASPRRSTPRQPAATGTVAATTAPPTVAPSADRTRVVPGPPPGRATPASASRGGVTAGSSSHRPGRAAQDRPAAAGSVMPVTRVRCSPASAVLAGSPVRAAPLRCARLAPGHPVDRRSAGGWQSGGVSRTRRASAPAWTSSRTRSPRCSTAWPAGTT